MSQTKAIVPKILYVDDDSDDCIFLIESFAAKSLTHLVCASDGEEAIKYLNSGKDDLPSLIILDLNMPRKDGKQTLKHIKSDPQLAKIPVVILVFNNNCLAFEYHEQKYRWDGNVVAEANDFTASDFALAAKALGATGMRVTNRQELSDALAKGIAADHPCVIDVIIDREAFPPVTNFDAVLEREL